ncbi:RebB family R body protein [Leptothoe spongobia]|uniref:RebB family R body protein n=1 Tax=Leptothoe spongobia TAU-MAC 1115 TaxID=1967444 RepID=A0A947GKP2_9CYAN|nr:RebB family R body protein [Leptothoe spongobia TAU-MAC 1115]
MATPDASIAATTLNSVGQAPSVAMGMVYVSMATSVGLAMENAVANQQRGQLIAETSLGQVLTMILSAGAKNP